jgi:hypothetical protein
VDQSLFAVIMEAALEAFQASHAGSIPVARSAFFHLSHYFRALARLIFVAAVYWLLGPLVTGLLVPVRVSDASGWRVAAILGRLAGL